MEPLNYQHLFYFWVIAREGGVAKAARKLRLSHSTLSAQLRMLEQFLGGDLFERTGKRLVPTPLGLQMAGYADDIFRLGNELVGVARGRSQGAHTLFRVGVVGSLPKTIAYRLMEPALRLDPSQVVVIRQDLQTRLVEELAAGKLDVVLTDTPPEASAFRLHAHVLGEAELLLFGAPPLAKKYGRRFPTSLHGAPVLLPSAGSLRRAMEKWFADRSIRVRVMAEVDDAGMLRVLGGHGVGLFSVRSALRNEVEEGQGAVSLGPLDGVRERYYAISVERRISHEGVAAIIEAARAELKTAASP